MSAVVWHDIECGRYTQDLALWRELADRHAGGHGALLDVGAGTGRVSLALARGGHRVVALDLDGELLAELGRRAAREALIVQTVCADARGFSLAEQRFGLIIAPMQTVQLLGGAAGQLGFLSSARAHMTAGSVVAVAIAGEEDFEEFQWHEGDPSPLPDIAEADGMSYFSQPTAVRREGDRFILDRRREWVDGHGVRSVSDDSVALDIVTAEGLHAIGVQVGLTPLKPMEIAPTEEHIGSQVVRFTV